jgi:glucosamine-6-phosphate deaminase
VRVSVPADTGVRVRVFHDAQELGATLAAEIARAADGRRFLLGCPGGRSLRSTYAALPEQDVDLSELVVVMMDEYVGVPADAPHSNRRFAQKELAGPLRLPGENVWLPDADNPEALDRRIEAAGGIGMFLLASGSSDGHVAFLGPGSPLDGTTAVVELAESTRRDNLSTFPHFRTIDDVPRRGVSVGLGTIRRLSRSVRLVLHGDEKRHATERLLALDRFDPKWPASVVYECADAEILVDRAAIGKSS